jgi:hypothetical protein
MKRIALKNQELIGLTVLLKPAAFKPGFEHLTETPFKCTGGFGCTPGLLGSKIFGTFADGRDGVARREWVAAIIPNVPRLDRIVEVATAAKAEYDNIQRAAANAEGKTAWTINFADQDALVAKRLAELDATLAAEGYEALAGGAN